MFSSDYFPNVAGTWAIATRRRQYKDYGLLTRLNRRPSPYKHLVLLAHQLY